ncbi:MAG: guanylate kinase [Alphaproteobacteria bacterium]|nr:guanylate kinase [Alphaproteobacteria bacterium]
MSAIERKGLMLIISSPSGAGKTTLANALLNSDKNIQLSISVTTRPKRKNEIHGKHYYFVTQKEYDEMLRNDMLMEHAEVFGYHYGTPKKQTETLLEKGIDIIYDIDWQGALQLMERNKNDIASIFIMPPSMEVLGKRLKQRDSDSSDSIQKRLSAAKNEISKSHYYDYILVNDNVEETLKKIQSCLEAERNKQSRLILSNFLSTFK